MIVKRKVDMQPVGEQYKVQDDTVGKSEGGGQKRHRGTGGDEGETGGDENRLAKRARLNNSDPSSFTHSSEPFQHIDSTVTYQPSSQGSLYPSPYPNSAYSSSAYSSSAYSNSHFPQPPVVVQPGAFSPPGHNPFSPSAPPIDTSAAYYAPGGAGLQYVLSTLGPRAAGTYEITIAFNNCYRLCVLDTQGGSATYYFTMDISTGAVTWNTATFSNLNQFLAGIYFVTYKKNEILTVSGHGFTNMPEFLDAYQAKKVEIDSSQFCTLESRMQQINTLQQISQAYCVSIDIDTLKKLMQPFMLTDQDFSKEYGKVSQKKKSPFVLRPNTTALIDEFRAELWQQIETENKSKPKTSFFQQFCTTVTKAVVNTKVKESLESIFTRLGNGNLDAGIDLKARQMAAAMMGDFQIVGCYLQRQSVNGTSTLAFERMDPLHVLPNGKVKSAGTSAEKFDELKDKFGLDDFLYDAYIKQQSDFHDVDSVSRALLRLPIDSFLIWQPNGDPYRYVSLKRGDSVETMQLRLTDGKWIMLGANYTLDVSGELFAYLKETLLVSRYKETAELSQALEPFWDSLGHDRRRIKSLQTHQNLEFDEDYFTMTAEKSGFLMTTHVISSDGGTWQETSSLIQITAYGEISVTTGAVVSNFATVPELMGYLKTKTSVKQLEVAREKEQEEMRKIQEVVDELSRQLKQLNAWRDFSYQADGELQSYWTILGPQCAGKALITKDVQQDRLLVTCLNNRGKLQKSYITITPEGVIRDNSCTLSMDLILGGLPLLSEAETAFKRKREEFLKRVSECPGTASSSLQSDFAQYAPLFSYLPQTYYILHQKLDADGVFQVAMSYTNTNGMHEQKELIIPTIDTLHQLEGKTGAELELALCRLATQKEPRLATGIAFSSIKAQIDAQRKAFDAKCQEVQKSACFVQCDRKAADRAMKEVHDYFTASPEIVKGCFLVRPWSQPTVGGYVFTIGHQGGTSEHKVFIINPITGRYHWENGPAFDSLQEALANFQQGRSYAEVVRQQQGFQVKEKELLCSVWKDWLHQISPGDYQITFRAKNDSIVVGRIKTRAVEGGYIVERHGAASQLCETVDEVIQALSS